MILFSNKKPTAPGYYFCKSNEYVTIIKLTGQPGKELKFVMFGFDREYRLTDINNQVEWAGPIEIPK